MIARPGFFVGLCALALAAQALAQDVVAPDLKSEASVRQWAANARISDVTANPTAVWTLIAAVEEGMLSYSVLAPPDAQKVAKVGIRMERFRENDGFRSDATVYDVDCGKDMFRKIQDASFAQHNFGGRRAERPVNRTWLPVNANALVNTVKAEACAGPLAPPVDIKDELAMKRWMAANNIRYEKLDGRIEWTLLGGSNEGLLFTSIGQLFPEERALELRLRRDFWRPLPQLQLGSMRSELVEYEVNCTSRLMRQIALTQYADWNMLGQPSGYRKLEEWLPINQHPFLADFLATTCSDFVYRREFKLRLPGDLRAPVATPPSMF